LETTAAAQCACPCAPPPEFAKHCKRHVKVRTVVATGSVHFPRIVRAIAAPLISSAYIARLQESMGIGFAPARSTLRRLFPMPDADAPSDRNDDAHRTHDAEHPRNSDESKENRNDDDNRDNSERNGDEDDGNGNSRKK
ncbi:hypothetical protein BTE48_17155, partial [Oceanospirillum multiglobuliferum]